MKRSVVLHKALMGEILSGLFFCLFFVPDAAECPMEGKG